MNYWSERTAKAQEELTTKHIKDVNKQIGKYYSQSMKRVINSFERTYDKVLLQMAQGKEPTPALLYKLDTYWKMQGEMREELQKLGNKQIVLLSKEFEKQYLDIYNAIALPSGAAYSTPAKENITQMINQIWTADSKSWSQRVWSNTERLAETLNEELLHCVVSGEKTTRLKKALQDRFGVSYERANTLVRTEMAHIQTEAAKERYRQYGITEVEVLVDADERTCDICAELEGKKYPINGAMPVPAHPNCRCCVVPVIKFD